MHPRLAAVLIVTTLTACSDGDHLEERENGEAQYAAPVARAAPARPMTAADSAAALARIRKDSTSVAQAFLEVKRLSWKEVWGLNRDRNATQIAQAQRLGVRASDEAEIGRLEEAGRLVAVGDSTAHWVLRKMEHSTPHATPQARAMLVELGQRFHAKLDSAGLPRYRMKITSMLRTAETQAELRKINANASQTVSAHEYGTTVDISHQRFAAPAPADSTDAAPHEILDERTTMLDEVGKEHAQKLQALLGRAIQDMRTEGTLLVMMEDAQPVYHMTLAGPVRPGS